MRVRPLDWAKDAAAAASLDASFTTDRVYAVERDALRFALVERPTAPMTKRYRVTADELRGAAHAAVADDGGRVVGVAALAFEPWNRRAVLSHIYVDRASRGRGAGASLLAEMRRAAASLGARQLWAETQDVNAPAIDFYRRHGFAWCGLDVGLYDPADVAGETALFFALGLEEGR